MAEKFTNNASGTLATAITSGATALDVGAGEGALFPSTAGGATFTATLISSTGFEIITVTARSTDTFTITRAQQGTTALAFAAGDKVKSLVTAQALNDFRTDIDLKAPLASPTFTGHVAVPTPTSATDAARKDYVDAALAGLSWKQAVRAATTTAGTLATDFANTSVVDGVTLATGDRILIKDQATGSENGIYIVAVSGAPTRSTDADASAELVNASVYVSEGTTNADTQWTCTTNAPITVGSTSLAFAQLTAGTATTLDGLSDVTITSPADLDVLGYNAGGTDWVNVASTGTGNNVRASAPTLTNPVVGTQSAGDNSTKAASTAYADNAVAKQAEVFMIAISDETTAITTGTAKVTFRMPFACSMTALPRANLNTASSSGLPAIDINKNGTSIFSTTITIDASELTSVTAATPAVLTSSPTTFADDDEIEIDIDTAGTGAKGLKITMNVVRT